MADERQIYDRNTLYEEVWAEPTQAVVKRYGVSDVALAKTCRRMGVPLPGRGYWAKVRAGRAEPRPPLPPLEAGQPARALIHRMPPQPPAPEWAKEAEQAVPIETSEPIVVSASLENPHKLVVLASRYLAKAHASDGLLSVARNPCLDIRVGPGSVDRALRIFDTLSKALEGVGLKVEVAAVEEAEPPHPRDYRSSARTPQPPLRVTRVVVDVEPIEFCLSEGVRRVEVPQLASPGKGEPSWQPRLYEHLPSGELTLQLTNTSGLGVRSKWQDGKKQRLEECLPDFIGNLSRVALAFKLRRRAEEEGARAAREAELRRWEEAKLREEQEERRREEARRGERLEAEVSRWRRAQDIREYVQAALHSLGAADLESVSDEEKREHLHWALAYAESLDPLRGT
ncbi:MAG: hypothetical protein ACYCX3_06675 [Thermoleophilia bacterium]